MHGKGVRHLYFALRHLYFACVTFISLRHLYFAQISADAFPGRPGVGRLSRRAAGPALPNRLKSVTGHEELF